MLNESVDITSHHNTSAQSNPQTIVMLRAFRIATNAAALLAIASILSFAGTLSAAPPITPREIPPAKSPPVKSPPTNTINNSPEFRITSANLRGNSPEKAEFARNTQSNSHTGS